MLLFPRWRAERYVFLYERSDIIAKIKLSDYVFGVYKYTALRDCTISGQDIKAGTIIYIGLDQQIDKNIRHKKHLYPSNKAQQVVNTWLQDTKEGTDWAYEVVEKFNWTADSNAHLKTLKAKISSVEYKYIEAHKPILNRQEGGDNDFRKDMGPKMPKSLLEDLEKIPSWQQVWRDLNVNEKFIELYEKFDAGEIDHLITMTARDFGKSFLTSLKKIIEMIKDPNKNWLVVRQKESHLGSSITQRYDTITQLDDLYGTKLAQYFKKFNPVNEWVKMLWTQGQNVNNQNEKFFSGEHFFSSENREKQKGFTVAGAKYLAYVEMEEFNQEVKESTVTEESVIRDIRSIRKTMERTGRRAGHKLKWVWNGNAADPKHPLVNVVTRLVDNKKFVKWAAEDPINNTIQITYHDKVSMSGTLLGRVAIVYGTSFFNPTIRADDAAMYERYNEVYCWTPDLEEKFVDMEPAEFSKYIGSTGEINKDNENGLYEIFGQVRMSSAGEALYRDTFKHYQTYPISNFLRYYDVKRLHMGLDDDKNKQYVISTIAEAVSKSTGEKKFFVLPQDVHLTSGVSIENNKKLVRNLFATHESMRDSFPHVSNPHIHIDDDKFHIATQMSYEARISGKKMLPIHRAKKHGEFKIEARQHFINTCTRSGDIVFLEGTEPLIKDFNNCVQGAVTGKRDERPGKNELDKINSVEYALWPAFIQLQHKLVKKGKVV